MSRNYVGRLAPCLPPRCAAAMVCLVVYFWMAAAAQAVSIPVICKDAAGNDVTVGDIDVNPSADGTGVTGGFTAVTTLAAAAAFCGEDHFNWFQVVLADNMPPNGPAGPGNPLTPPYFDPPLGGYGPPDTQWGDGLPWYWDEGADPPAGPPPTPGFSDGYNLDDNISLDGKTLHFEDFPGGAAGTSLVFATFLVSLNADGSLHSFHDGFLWTWSNTAANPDGTAAVGQHLAGNQGQQLYNQLVPEPSSIVLAVLGLAFCAVGCYRHRRQ